MLRIAAVKPLDGFRLELTLTDGQTVTRDVGPLMSGPLFEPMRRDKSEFDRVFTQDDSIAWPNGADLCPDVLIWGGPPPVEQSELAATAR